MDTLKRGWHIILHAVDTLTREPYVILPVVNMFTTSWYISLCLLAVDTQGGVVSSYTRRYNILPVLDASCKGVNRPLVSVCHLLVSVPTACTHNIHAWDTSVVVFTVVEQRYCGRTFTVYSGFGLAVQ